MILWLINIFENLPDPVQRLFSYVSFRSLMAMLTAFLFGVFMGKKLINIIYQFNFRDMTRDYGDISSKNKSGTPTMGGVIIFLSFLISMLLWAKLDNFFIGIILLAGFWF
ncbi:MAG: phospho-N-acetylmuramoyl-pentapeptide-transferase, partial [Candidatus Aminicenantes bacterium]|nr:phospho-N-acetylmuramoyl-pentapeptide-transferase [Candidatus Aminicenantes bacterium]